MDRVRGVLFRWVSAKVLVHAVVTGGLLAAQVVLVEVQRNPTVPLPVGVFVAWLLGLIAAQQKRETNPAPSALAVMRQWGRPPAE